MSSLIAVLLFAGTGLGQRANLLRHGDFQDDRITLLPQTKNHHWCFSSEFYNRRDYNQDCWYCKGSWDWLDADKPRGERRFIMKGPARKRCSASTGSRSTTIASSKASPRRAAFR